VKLHNPLGYGGKVGSDLVADYICFDHTDVIIGDIGLLNCYSDNDGGLVLREKELHHSVLLLEMEEAEERVVNVLMSHRSFCHEVQWPHSNPDRYFYVSFRPVIQFVGKVSATVIKDNLGHNILPV
jgi:hypothetical protein